MFFFWRQTGLNFMANEFEDFFSSAIKREAIIYYSLVMDEFHHNPPWWRPLSKGTIAYKHYIRKYGIQDKVSGGLPVGTPSEVLVNYGLMRDSIDFRPGRMFPTSNMPNSFDIGFFKGLAPTDRILYAWRHEFGTRYLIAVRHWNINRAKGMLRRLIGREMTTMRTGMKLLKISKEDIEGGGSIERFINVIKRMVIKAHTHVTIKINKPAKRIVIPPRSILRLMLDQFAPTFATDMVNTVQLFKKMAVMAQKSP